MTAQQTLDAWRKSQKALDFYIEFERLTGITVAQVQTHFGDWNKKPHEEAVRIAEKHGMTVKEGGFQAYLSDVAS